MGTNDNRTLQFYNNMVSLRVAHSRQACNTKHNTVQRRFEDQMTVFPLLVFVLTACSLRSLAYAPLDLAIAAGDPQPFQSAVGNVVRVDVVRHLPPYRLFAWLRASDKQSSVNQIVLAL